MKKSRHFSTVATLLFAVAAAFSDVPGFHCAQAQADELSDATALFGAAESRLDTGHLAEAASQFETIQEHHPNWLWPRKFQYSWGLTYFRMGELEKAEKIWGRMLCESRTDELSFAIAYNLSLAQEKLGRIEQAYWTLQMVPQQVVLTKSQVEQRLYFQFKGELAQRLELFFAAARNYATAFTALKESRDKSLFREKFRSAAAKIRNGNEKMNLKEGIHDPTLQADLPAMPQNSALAGSRSPIQVQAREGIEGLKLIPLAVEEVTPITATSAVKLLHVIGQYRRSKRTLYCGGTPVPLSKKGRFIANLDITGQSASISLLSIARGHSVERQTEDYVQFDWNHFRPPKFQLSAVERSEIPVVGALARDNVSDNRKYLLIGSLLIGTSYFFPAFSLQRRINPHLALGIDLFGMAFSNDALNSLVIGSYLDLNFYSRRLSFTGLWVRLGFGLHVITLSDGNLKETVPSPSIRSTVGWRWMLGENWQVGTSVGAQYLAARTGKFFIIDMSGLMPLVTLDAALTF